MAWRKENRGKQTKERKRGGKPSNEVLVAVAHLLYQYDLLLVNVMWGEGGERHRERKKSPFNSWPGFWGFFLALALISCVLNLKRERESCVKGARVRMRVKRRASQAVDGEKLKYSNSFGQARPGQARLWMEASSQQNEQQARSVAALRGGGVRAQALSTEGRSALMMMMMMMTSIVFFFCV